MSRKRKLKIERTLADVVAAVCSCGDITDLIEIDRIFIQKRIIQRYRIS